MGETVKEWRRDAAIALTLVLASGAVWSLGWSDAGFGRPDAYDYAQMGRELRHGRGFSTRQIFPRHVSWLAAREQLAAPDWPNLHRYPLPTLLHAGAQFLEPDAGRAAVLQGGLAFAFSVGLAFLLARRVVGTPAALVAALLVASDPLVFDSAYNGMSEAAAIALTFAAFRLALAPAPGLARAGGVGVLCGLAVLLRTQLALLLPLACLQLAAAAPRRRLLAAALVVAGCGAAVAPWAVRNVALTGQPLFSFSSSRNLAKPFHPDPDLDLHAPVAIVELLAAHPGALREKLVESLTERLPSPGYWRRSLGAVGAGSALLLIASFAWRRHGPVAADALRFGALAFLAANFGVMAFSFHTERFYTVPRALLTLAAVCEFALLAARAPASPWRRNAARVLAMATALFAVARFGMLLSEQRGRPERPPSDRRAYALLTRELRPGAIVASDVSERVALHAQRRSVRLPLDPEQLLELDAELLRIDHLVLGPVIERLGERQRRVPIPYRKYRAWSGFAESPEFQQRFERVRELPNGLVLYTRRASRD
jgi:hypothetical protein